MKPQDIEVNKVYRKWLFKRKVLRITQDENLKSSVLFMHMNGLCKGMQDSSLLENFADWEDSEVVKI